MLFFFLDQFDLFSINTSFFFFVFTFFSVQSDTCTIDIPELDSEFGASGLGGRFTTVEGILNAIREQIIDNSAVFHDSADAESKQKIDKYEQLVFFFFFNSLLFESQVIFISNSKISNHFWFNPKFISIFFSNFHDFFFRIFN